MRVAPARYRAGRWQAHVYRAKGGKSRTVHFDAETAQALQAYWNLRATRSVAPAPAGLQRTGQGWRSGNPISPRTVEHIIGQLCTMLGIESEVTPHSFRHGLATEMVRRRVRESTVQTILGHASPQTTRIYVHKSAVEVADDIRTPSGNTARHPGPTSLPARRWIIWLAMGCWCITLLSACASGNADSANEAATREAGKATNVVANIEATQVMREFFDQHTTPTPFRPFFRRWQTCA